jgi:hypothetical protein
MPMSERPLSEHAPLPERMDEEQFAAPEIPEVADEDAAAELFSRHVDMVREKGDMLDIWKNRTTINGVLPSMMTSGYVAGEVVLPAFAETGTTMAFPILGSIMVGAIAVSSSLYARDNRENKFKKASAEDELGERYELYRTTDDVTGGQEITMRWRGSFDKPGKDGDNPKPARPKDESLELIAKLAEANGIKKVLVDADIFGVDRSKAIGSAINNVPVDGWLEQTKGVPARFTRDKETIHPHNLVFSPTSLRLLAQETRLERTPMRGPDAAIELIRSRNPVHPLVVQYDAFQADPKVLAQRVRSTSRKLLERRLDDTTVVYDSKKHLAPNPQRVHLTGNVEGTTVTWRGMGEHYNLVDNREDLLAAVGMPGSEVEAVLSEPYKYPDKQVILAAECAAYLRTTEATVMTESPKSEVEPALVSGKSLQTTVALALETSGTKKFALEEGKHARKVDVQRLKAQRLLLGLTALTAVMVGTHKVDGALQDQRESIIQSDTEAYAAHAGKPVSYLSEAELKAIREQAMDDHPLLRAGLVIPDAVDSLFARLDEWRVHNGSGVYHDNGGVSGLSFKQGKVGNEKDSESDTAPEWQLAPHGNMPVDGYWATNTGWWMDKNGTWHPDQEQPDMRASYSIETELAKGSSPDYVKVSRVLDYSEVQHRVNEGRTFGYFINPPILQGTYPAAANLNGEPVGLHYNDNGAVSFSFNRLHEGDVLTYWLAPADNAGVFATKNVGLLTQKGDDVDQEFDDIGKAMDQARADAGIPSVVNQLDGDLALIRNHFTYTKQSLSEQTTQLMQDGKLDYSDFVASQMKVAQADCDVANTLLVMNDRSLNTAWGYLNEGNLELEAGEAHMWAVDADRKVYDATPAAEFSAQAAGSQESLPAANLIQLGLFGALGATVVGKYLGYKTERRRAQLRWQTYGADDLHKARQVVDMAAYQKDKAVDLSKLQPAADELTKEAATEKLRNHHVHSGYVAESLQDALAKARNRAERRQIKRARRVIRTLQVIGQADRTYEPGDNEISSFGTPIVSIQ